MLRPEICFTQLNQQHNLGWKTFTQNEILHTQCQSMQRTKKQAKWNKKHTKRWALQFQFVSMSKLANGFIYSMFVLNTRIRIPISTRSSRHNSISFSYESLLNVIDSGTAIWHFLAPLITLKLVCSPCSVCVVFTCLLFACVNKSADPKNQIEQKMLNTETNTTH